MKQRGYAALLFIPALLMVALSVSMIDPAANKSNIRQLDILTDARQQLISYATAYLESYKPTGAGPGHLPCPDTDHTPDEYKVQAGLRGDGPNPPCGKHTIAIGKLPRHISHGNHRYAFHLEDRHALWYAVDTQFINNPVNRVVNVETAGRIRLNPSLPAAAMVFIAVEESLIWKQSAGVVAASLQQAFQGGRGIKELQASISQYVLISPAALLDAVSLRVAFWLQEQYQATNPFACASNTSCWYAVIRSCDVPLRTKMMSLMFESVDSVKCDGSADDLDRIGLFINDARLESIFFWRHWFYRNDWWRFVDLKIEDECLLASIDCNARVSLSATQQSLQLQFSAQ